MTITDELEAIRRNEQDALRQLRFYQEQAPKAQARVDALARDRDILEGQTDG